MNPLLIIGGIALVGALIAMQYDDDGDTYSTFIPFEPDVPAYPDNNAPWQPYNPDTNRMASIPGRTA
jgi:hypothetical protein